MRVKSNVARHRKKVRIRKAAKGRRGGRSKLHRQVIENNMRALRYAYIGRKERKRDFRRLWIERINAAARREGMPYSRFMHGLTLANVDVDRRTLAELAVSDPETFAELAGVAREALSS